MPPGVAVPRTFAVAAAVAVVCAWDAPDEDVVALSRPVRPEEGESDLVCYLLSANGRLLLPTHLIKTGIVIRIVTRLRPIHS